jgi:hypothetical protein
MNDDTCIRSIGAGSDTELQNFRLIQKKNNCITIVESVSELIHDCTSVMYQYLYTFE